VVVQVDAQSLLGIINRDSSKLAINKLSRDLFWFGLVNGMTLSVECVPREENAFADELSKLLIPGDWRLAPKLFSLLEARWGPHSVDLLASSDNTQCEKFYSLHWCRGTAGVNACSFAWSGEKCWANVPYKAIGRVWRALREQQAVATLLVPMWESSIWWHLVVPDGPHLSEYVVDWMWLPKGDPDLFIGGKTPGRTILQGFLGYEIGENRENGGKGGGGRGKYHILKHGPNATRLWLKHAATAIAKMGTSFLSTTNAKTTKNRSGSSGGATQ